MGDGFMIMPEDGTVVSPADGVVKIINKAKHSIIIRTDREREILIHLGIDTVSLNGEGFEIFVKENDSITKGQIICKMDLEFIKRNDKSIATPIIFTNLQPDEFLYFKDGSRVKQGKGDIVQIHKK